MVFSIEKRPDCNNPNCKNSAMIMIGRKFYCGDCAVKIQNALDNKNDLVIQELFKNEKR